VRKSGCAASPGAETHQIVPIPRANTHTRTRGHKATREVLPAVARLRVKKPIAVGTPTHHARPQVTRLKRTRGYLCRIFSRWACTGAPATRRVCSLFAPTADVCGYRISAARNARARVKREIPGANAVVHFILDASGFVAARQPMMAAGCRIFAGP